MQKTKKSFIFYAILYHFLLKPKLEHAVGNENSILLQGNQFLVDESFLDAVDIGFTAQWVGFCYCLGGEARVNTTAEEVQKVEQIGG